MRQFNDFDLRGDLDWFCELFEEYIKIKIIFDEYVGEVNFGCLYWFLFYCNIVFWVENVCKILDYENGVFICKLVDIMKQLWEDDKLVLVIVCNDVGCLVCEVFEKRGQLEKFGLKMRVMELMGEVDENVWWESLCVLGGWLQYSFDMKQGEVELWCMLS